MGRRQCAGASPVSIPIPDFQIIPAPNEWHYRARAQWQYDSVRRRLGYFQSGSRRICDVAECAVLVPDLQAELERLRELMQEGAFPDEARSFRGIAGDDEVSISDDVVGRAHDVSRTIHGERYRTNAESFFQTNMDLLPQLIDEAIGAARGEQAVELYCGVGLFTVPLARHFERVIGIESDARATDFARRNLVEARLTNARVVNQNVAEWLELNLESARNGDGLDYLLLDPPRTGAESRLISGILKLKPQKICYVSCDPATLARDLKKLLAGGYTIQRIIGFDMFPQTHHVETVVQLATESADIRNS